jgi:transposase InsO family protein
MTFCTDSDVSLQPNDVQQVASDVQQFFTVEELSQLAGVGIYAIHKAIKRNRLKSQRNTVETKYRKGHQDHLIPTSEAFRVYPKARVEFEARCLQRIHDEETQRKLIANQTIFNPLPNRFVAGRGVTRKKNETQGTARHFLVEQCKQYLEDVWQGRKYEGIEAFIEKLITGGVELPDWFRTSGIKIPSVRTLQRWMSGYEAKGIEALDSKYAGNETGELEKHSEQAQYLESMVLNVPHIRGTHLKKMLDVEFKGDAVSYGVIARWLNEFRQTPVFLSEANPDKYRAKYKVAYGSASESITRLNQVWEADSTKADIIFKGDRKRYTITGVIDVYSGRVMYMLVETGSGRAHAELFRRAILKWGLPETIKTDNGKDYTSEYLRRAFAELRITHKTCNPYSPSEKPFIERSFRTLMHSELFELMTGFTGHNVAEAQIIRSRVTFALRAKNVDATIDAGVTKAEFEDLLEKWMHTEEHRARKKTGRFKGKTPAEAVNEWCATPGNLIKRVKDEALIYWLQAAKSRTVTKKGIQHNSRPYIHEELYQLEGQDIEIRESPETPGRIAVFHDGVFFCHAVNPELTEVSNAEIAAKARELQKAEETIKKAQRRDSRKRTSPAGAIRALLDEQANKTPSLATLQQALMLETETTAANTAAVDAERQIAKSTKKAGERPKEAYHADRYYDLRYQDSITEKDAEWMRHYENTPGGEAVKKSFKGMPYPPIIAAS